MSELTVSELDDTTIARWLRVTNALDEHLRRPNDRAMIQVCKVALARGEALQELTQALQKIRKVRHHWCYGETNGCKCHPPICDCGKEQRDALIDAALAGLVSHLPAETEGTTP